MPGTNAGTGSPIVFKCARCRMACRRTWRPDLGGYIDCDHDVKLTGKWRKLDRGGSLRTARAEVEYKCACGHTGKSKHIDIVRRAVREGVIPSGTIEHRGRLLVKGRV